MKMKLYVPMYLIGGLGLAVGLASGTPEGGHLMIVEPWAFVLKASAVLAIAAWFVEAYYIVKESR